MKKCTRIAGVVIACLLAIALGGTLHAQDTTTLISNGAPYEHDVNVIMDQGKTSANVKLTDVPVGKRLVIRQVTGIAYGPLGEKYKLILLTSVNDGTDVWHPISTSGESFDDPEAQAHATIFTVPTYINARRGADGIAVAVSLVRSFGSFNHASFFRIGISGYLIDDPTQPIIIGR